MGYIGRTPAYGNFEKDNHTGDGVTSQFNLTYPVASPTQLLVSLDGVIQEPDYSYNVTMVSGQGKINFSEAPDIGARIFIVYVGRQLLTAGSNAPSTYLDEFNGDNSTVSFTLTRTPATTDAANFIVYVDNIYQREGSSYAFTISGETITFTSAPPTGTNNIQVYQLALSNEVNTVSDGAVTEAKLANGAVTSAKINDGAVTSAKINDGDVTLAKLASGVNTITQADIWRLTASVTSNGDITSNLERADSTSSGLLGTGMTESSGIFSFPETGIYLITVQAYIAVSSPNDNVAIATQVTTNNSSYSNESYAVGHAGGGAGDTTAYSQLLVDVTDIGNVKLKFAAVSIDSSGNIIYGNSANNQTSFSFIRLGDT